MALMKQRYYDRAAAAISVLLLAVLAGFSYYLAELSEQFQRSGGERKLTHEPDYFVERLAMTRVNKNGDPVFRMSAERLQHYPDDDSSEFVRPLLVSLDPAKPLVTLSANRGTASSGGDETHLHDNVVLTRAAIGEQPPLRISTEYLLLLPEEDIARTHLAARIEYGQSSLTGVGMEFNNATRTLNVQSKVRGSWVPPAR